MLTSDLKRRLALGLFAAGHIRLWSRHQPEGWILQSGLWSPFYIQLRNLGSHVELVRLVGQAMADLVEDTTPRPTRLIGIAMAGVPLAVATSMSSGIPFAYTRKTSELLGLGRYGQHAALEGELAPDDTVALIDDVATTFSTKLGARSVVQAAAAENGVTVTCDAVYVVIDREQGASEEAVEAGMQLHSLLRFETEALSFIADELTTRERDTIRLYLKDPTVFSDPERRTSLIQDSE